MRGEWLQAVTREVQVLAVRAWTADADAGDIAAQLASAMPPPLERLEHIVAVHFLQRATWEVLKAAVQRGTLSPASAHVEFRRIVDVTERAPWPEIPRRLRVRDMSASHHSPVARRIRDYVDGHALEKLTLDRLAHEVGCSVRTVTAEFRREYGISVHLYVIKCRLAEAARLLATTEMKVSAVAEAVGFHDHTALYRHFRRLAGVTPGVFRHDPARAGTMTKAAPPPSPH